VDRLQLGKPGVVLTKNIGFTPPPDGPIFYSQNGEDVVLYELFRHQAEGFFVEIGCIDGRRFSNTLFFADRGWRGLCVEAHGDYIEQLKTNRPESIVCHCAVGGSDQDDVPFYANRRGSLSTLDSSREAGFRARFGEYFSGFELQHVRQRKLNTIFEQFGLRKVDILSIDVEGSEAEVLLGLDLHRYRPRVMVIEADTPADEKKIDAILLPAGYVKSVKVVNNAFYLMEKSMASGLLNKQFDGILTHTRHPLDVNGDSFVPFSLDFRETSGTD
jgi:FkbM family methyltransferase